MRTDTEARPAVARAVLPRVVVPPFRPAMRATSANHLSIVAALLLALAACRRASLPSSDAGASVPDTVTLSLRVPAGLTVARALDTLSVSVDPDTLGVTE